MSDKIVLILISILVVCILLKLFVTRENMVPIQDEITSKAGFLPSHQGPYFQGLPPTLDIENTYHTLIRDDCNGDYSNLECRQKAYIKTVKGGTTDKADLICLKYKNDEDTYYKCLDGVYGNYIWMDRFTGASPCVCNSATMPGQGQGALGADGRCWCGRKRPLKQRWQLDQNGEIVDRLNARRTENFSENLESSNECSESCGRTYYDPILDACFKSTTTRDDYIACVDRADKTPLQKCEATCG